MQILTEDGRLVPRGITRFERRGANPTLPWGDSTPPSSGMLGGAVAGTNVTEKTAIQVAAVYGSVSVIADSVATAPLNLLSSVDAATRKRLPPSPLITQPYAEISLVDWLVQYVWSLALRGNFYGQVVERDRKTLYPTQIKPVHPDQVRVTRLPDGTPEYRYWGAVVPIDQVFHIRLMSLPGSLVGLNAIEYLKNTIGLARASDLYAASFFQNSAMPSGVIEIEDDLDEEETLNLAKAWTQAHQGIGQANLPAVLTGGAKFAPISINPEDAQFLENRQYTAGEISGMIFRIPPHMIGIVDRTTSWGMGIEQQELGFVRNTLAGYLVRLENALTVLHPPNQYARFDLSERLRGDKLQRYQAYSLGRLGGWLTPNRILAAENEPPLDPGQGGDDVILPINTEMAMAAVQQSIAASQAAKAGVPPPNAADSGAPPSGPGLT